MLKLAALLLVPLALAAAAAAGKGGPEPGVLLGGYGVVDRAAGVRYVALPGGRTTVVTAIRTRDGRVLRSRTLGGAYGVPLVAFDGTADGVSPDGRTLVLAQPYDASTKLTRFAALRTTSLRPLEIVSLRGRWAFDALSPNGRTLYATQYFGDGANARYAVRSVSLVTGRPIGGPLVDRRGPGEEMAGAPWSRVRSVNGGWAYTLYAKPSGEGFVHALDTARRRAYCVDLPWRSTTQALSQVRLSLERSGRQLVLSSPLARLAVVDTRTFRVKAFARP